MSVKCQSCAALIALSHAQLGTTVDCPACGARTLLKYEMGVPMPPSGWAVTFTDFVQLLREASWRKRVGPLVAGWFDCEVCVTPDRVQLVRNDGSLWVLEHVHAAIQADSAKQEKLYGTAMDLWR